MFFFQEFSKVCHLYLASTRLLMVVQKSYQLIGVAVHLHCIESFEVLLQRCRRGRGCNEWWKNTIFPEHPVHNLPFTEGRESQVRAAPPPCLNMSRQFLSQAGSIKCVVSAAKFSESETKKLYFSFWSRNRDSLPGKNVIVFSEKDICFRRQKYI